jgi:hypothetical protein
MFAPSQVTQGVSKRYIPPSAGGGGAAAGQCEPQNYNRGGSRLSSQGWTVTEVLKLRTRFMVKLPSPPNTHKNQSTAVYSMYSGILRWKLF